LKISLDKMNIRSLLYARIKSMSREKMKKMEATGIDQFPPLVGEG